MRRSTRSAPHRHRAHGVSAALAIGAMLLLAAACGAAPVGRSVPATSANPSPGAMSAETMTPATAVSDTGDLAEPPEGSFVEGDAPLTPIGENPLSGAIEMPSWDAFFAAAQKAAKDAQLAVTVVDPRPALGIDVTIWFTGAAASFVTPDATVVESLGASGSGYLDTLVRLANEVQVDPTLVAVRTHDDTLDCAYLPGPDQDELRCGIRGTVVDFMVRHSATSAGDLEQMARLVMPTATWLNPPATSTSASP